MFPPRTFCLLLDFHYLAAGTMLFKVELFPPRVLLVNHTSSGDLCWPFAFQLWSAAALPYIPFVSGELPPAACIPHTFYIWLPTV